jgi:hypothetical protein
VFGGGAGRGYTIEDGRGYGGGWVMDKRAETLFNILLEVRVRYTCYNF